MSISNKNLTFALAGNPNSGKTTLFNRLTGSGAPVGNWPGVTVEKKAAAVKYGENIINIVDLPGIYSIVPYTPEEAITGNYLKNEKPDLIINVVDASNLERNLYLTTQLMESGIPIVIALSMADVARSRGNCIDCRLLSLLLNIPVVPVYASKGKGIDALLKAAAAAVKKPAPRCRRVPKPDAGCRDPELELAAARYGYIHSVTGKAVKKDNPTKKNITEKIDRVATNRFLAFPLFALVIFLIFTVTFGLPGDTLVSWVDFFLSSCVSPCAAALLDAAGVSFWVQRLILDGVLGGVGAVLKFLPQISLLFLLLSLLEDSGYMARAAFIMDAPMRKIGLSGRAFVTLLMGFGCTVPAVIGTRILENEKEKRLTALITPFMSCSAKIPVYSMIISAFFADRRPLAMFLLYALGVIMGLLSALLFKNSFLRGTDAPFVMELPDYRMPSAENIRRHVGRRVKDFLQRAGTAVFAATVLVWALQSVSVDFHMTFDSSQSLLAAAGRVIAPVFSLCGFGGWKPAVALLTGLTAKESIAGTLGVLCSSAGLSEIFTPPAACSFLIFVLLYTPCFASLTAIRRETGNVKFALLSALYQFAAAWYVSAMFYQCAMLLTYGVSS